MIYIATTTINSPSIALKKFTKDNNCKLIVALDKNSKKFELKNSVVLTTSYQEKKWPKLSQLIGWNCIQRRNIAILEAYERGAEIIALIEKTTNKKLNVILSKMEPDEKYLCADNSKAKKFLKYQINTDLEHGITQIFNH